MGSLRVRMRPQSGLPQRPRDGGVGALYILHGAVNEKGGFRVSVLMTSLKFFKKYPLQEVKCVLTDL